MCGLAGVAGLPLEVARPAAERMLAALRHRGPDGEGLEVLTRPGQAPLVLAHTRLAIVDLSPTGRQPLCARPGDPRAPWIAFNGEAYEAPELRGALAREGLRARGTSDTEAVLLGYQRYGCAVYERVRGMFAWAVADPGEGTLWLARDRLGLKPLYVVRPPVGGLLFASEVRALLAAGLDLVPRRLEARALESFLAQGAVIGERTLFAGIESLPAGASQRYDWEGRPLPSPAPWRLVRRPAPVSCEPAEAAAQVGATLREAVAQHLRADVEVGLFLSGGVDSAALATLVSEGGRRPHTLSLGFDRPELDESALAAEIAGELDTAHQERRLAGRDALAAFEEVLSAVDQPTVDGFNTWFVAREARRAGLKVVLSGVGGDELFGGYASFRDVPRARALARLLGPTAGLLRALPLGGRRGLKLRALAERPPSLLELYLLRRELWLPGERRALFPPGAGRGVPEEVLAPLRALDREAESLSALSRLELALYLRYMLLRDGDVFSMAHGLELRLPLLDHVLVEQVSSLPDACKRRGRGDPPKPLLVRATGPRLPPAALGPKRGFTFPWEDWLRGPLWGRVRAALGAREAWSQLGLDPAAVAGLEARFLARDPAVPALGLLSLVVLEDYARRHGVWA